MEPWQRIGTYTAGLALADAGIRENAGLLSTMDMIIAAGGGERVGRAGADEAFADGVVTRLK